MVKEAGKFHINVIAILTRHGFHHQFCSACFVTVDAHVEAEQ